MLSIDSVELVVGARVLLRDVSTHVAPGEVLAVIGPNGAGKTSLLHAVIGDLDMARGAITFAGRAIARMADRERACRIALLPQFSALAFPFTVREVVALGRAPHASGVTADRAIIDAAMTAADIAHLRARAYTRLSGGEKQRVQLARVMTQIWREADAGARLLLLDEPVAALDLGHQQWIMNQIRALADDGVAVVMVLHDISLAARHADRMLALRDARVVAHGTPEAVVTQQTVRRLFDVEARVIAHPETGSPVVLHA
jgi:iron complex transport system ATP-binding protein